MGPLICKVCCSSFGFTLSHFPALNYAPSLSSTAALWMWEWMSAPLSPPGTLYLSSQVRDPSRCILETVIPMSLCAYSLRRCLHSALPSPVCVLSVLTLPPSTLLRLLIFAALASCMRAGHLT